MIEVFKDGGLFFTCPIFFLLLLITGIWVKALFSEKNSEKYIFLIAQLSWFALAWGYLGRTLGLIEGFDEVAQIGEFSPQIVTATIQKALINPGFGLVTFLTGRFAIIVLKLKQKDRGSSD